MRNYYNYFTEIEERFQQRRGSLLMLSTLDWALIENWRDAGLPLEAVLRGIDMAFDAYEARKAKGNARKVNGLAWCAQAVMETAEQMREAAIGTNSGANTEAAATQESGFEQQRIAEHLQLCVSQLSGANVPAGAQPLVSETTGRLQDLHRQALATRPDNEALETTLRTLEEKLLAMLTASAPEAELTKVREEAARTVAPYKSRMGALQLRQIQQQFIDKRLLEQYAVPRLSLFYMRSDA